MYQPSRTHFAPPERCLVVIAATTGGTPTGDIGVLGIAIKVQDFAYLAGGLVFGIALYRSRCGHSPGQDLAVSRRSADTTGSDELRPPAGSCRAAD